MPPDPQLLPPGPSLLPSLYQPPQPAKAAPPRKQLIDVALANNDSRTLQNMGMTGSERAYVARQKAIASTPGHVLQQATAQAAKPADAVYNARSGGTQGVVPGVKPEDLKALRTVTKQQAQTNPISPAAVVAKLADEVAAVGPGLVSTGIAAYHHPIRTAEQVGKATVQSLKETGTHPLRQLGSDPLGFLSNLSLAVAAPGSIAGRAGAVADAARAEDVGAVAKVGKVAKAAIEQPRPVERTVVTARDTAGNATHAVHPLGSINTSIGMLQKHVIDPVTQWALDNPDKTAAKILNNRLVGPQVKVGREIRAAERVKTASAQAPAAAIARAAKKLSAPEAKAVLIKASGRPAEDWAALEKNAVDQGIGFPKAQKAQLALTRAAMKHVDSPRVTAAADVMRTAMNENGDLKGLSDEEQLQRLGAHSLAIQHGANGFLGENPAQELNNVNDAYAKLPDTRANAEARDALAARGDELRAQLQDEGQRVRDTGGFYTPMLRESKPLQSVRNLVGSRQSKYGMSAAVREPKGYPYEGGMLARGDYKTDVGRITGSAYRNTQSIAQARRVHGLLYDMGKPTKDEAGGEKFAEAVRPTQAVSESLKRMANTESPLKAPKGEEGLSDAVKAWYDETQAKPGEDIRYVDKRMLAPLRPYEPLMGKMGEAVDRGNQIIRVGRYMLPRYLQWLPQNFAFTAPRQGAWMVRNAAKFKTELPKLAPEVRDKIFSVMGQGPSHSLEGDTQFLGKTQETLGNFWNRVNDTAPRAMAWIHEAESAGFHNAAGYTKLVTDPKLEQKFVDVTRRANKESGDYSMSNVERATLKKLVPSWAWDKASSQYVGRLLIEHPYLSRFLATEGSQGQKQVDAFFQHLHGLMPSYLAGVLPLNGHEGIDTSGISPTDTPAQLMQILSGTEAPAKTLAPIPSGALGLLTGLSTSGQKQSRERTLLNTAEKFGPAREVATGLGKPGLFGAGWKTMGLDAAGDPIEQVNMKQAAKSGFKDLSTQAQRDQAARQKALEETGSMIRQTNAPKEWQKSYMIGTQAEVDRTQAKAAAKRALGSGKKMPEAQSYQITMQTLVKHGMMSKQQYQRAMAAVPKMTGHQLTYWEQKAWNDLGPGKILSKFRSYYHKVQESKQKPVGAAAATG